MTLVERQTRLALACKLPNKQAETINKVVKKLLAEHPIPLMKEEQTITLRVF